MNDNTMQAVWISKPGGPEVLEVRAVPKPQAGADQVLVRVRASALNRADLLQRQGRYPAPAGFPQEIPGMEFAGEVEAVGPLAKMWVIIYLAHTARNEKIIARTGNCKS